MTNDPSDVTVEKKNTLRFIKGLPECPKCKTIKNMRFANVTEGVYECLRCTARFRVEE